jgi:uncharacterized metal-binding protein
MPKGKTHDQIAFISLIPTFLAGLYIFQDTGKAAILTLFTLSASLMLGPDLDTRSNNYYRWGWMRFIWYPYRKLIVHRSRISHSFLIGPFIRTLYLSTLLFAVFFVLCYFFLYGDFSGFFSLIKKIYNTAFTGYGSYFVAAFAGIMWANAQHIIADRTVSTYKKALKKV